MYILKTDNSKNAKVIAIYENPIEAIKHYEKILKDNKNSCSQKYELLTESEIRERGYCLCWY